MLHRIRKLASTRNAGACKPEQVSSSTIGRVKVESGRARCWNAGLAICVDERVQDRAPRFLAGTLGALATKTYSSSGACEAGHTASCRRRVAWARSACKFAGQGSKWAPTGTRPWHAAELLLSLHHLDSSRRRCRQKLARNGIDCVWSRRCLSFELKCLYNIIWTACGVPWLASHSTPEHQALEVTQGAGD